MHPHALRRLCMTPLGTVKVGGKDVITGTVEVIRDLPRNFGIATFFDYGNAFNRFSARRWSIPSAWVSGCAFPS